MCTLIVAALIALLAVVAWFLVGPERLWSMFGSADLGPVEFATLVRRANPNDALACSPRFCKANSDFLPPTFATDAQGLRAAMARVIASEPNIRNVGSGDVAMTERYVQRTPLLRFPDTIVVRYFQLEPGEGNTLAIYSRSQLGYSDMGIKKARIARWIDRLKTLVPVAE
ncbi:MAG: DUF1499 domain-containing protein [Rhizobiales bacterium]|nr:DUF1499 domain-containing protein [Hyphomicrobiales bacterium]